MSDWFDSGYEGIPKADEEYEKRGGGELRRFWLKPGASAEIVFETDEPLCFWEHHLKLGGSWQNWFTCRRDSEDGCHICENGDNPAYVGVFVIRDMTGWESKKGKGRQGVGRRMLFVVKRKTLKMIQTLKERREDGLVGLRFAVSRSDENSANCGDLFDFLRNEDMSALPDAGDMPNLMEMFKPLTNVEMASEVGGGSSSGGKGGGGGGSTEDDIPF